MQFEIQNERFDVQQISRLYPAAVIRYKDGSITPISLEWYETLANEDVTLLHYAICLHLKEEQVPRLFFYGDQRALEEAMGDLARQLQGL